MDSPQTRATLERCLSALEGAEVADELRLLAVDLVRYLLNMHDEGRLNAPLLLLALDSLELVPELEECVAKLRTTVKRETAIVQATDPGSGLD